MKRGFFIDIVAKCNYTDLLAPEGEVSYQISALTANGETALSAPVVIDMNGIAPTGAERTTAYYDTHSRRLMVPGATRVVITGIDGHSTVLTAPVGYIDLGEWPTGLYVARISTGQSVAIVKFLR